MQELRADADPQAVVREQTRQSAARRRGEANIKLLGPDTGRERAADDER